MGTHSSNGSFGGMSGTVLKGLGLILGIIFVVVPIVTSVPISSSIEPAQYSNGDGHLDFILGTSDSSVAGIDSRGIITCGADSGNHADCGKDKFTAVSSILSILTIVIAVGIIAAAGWWWVQRYQHGVGNTEMLITGAVTAAITVVIALIVIPITFTPLEDAIVWAHENGFTAAVPLLKLVPLILVVGAIFVSALLTGIVGTRGGSTMSG